MKPAVVERLSEEAQYKPRELLIYEEEIPELVAYLNENSSMSLKTIRHRIERGELTFRGIPIRIERPNQ